MKRMFKTTIKKRFLAMRTGKPIPFSRKKVKKNDEMTDIVEKKKVNDNIDDKNNNNDDDNGDDSKDDSKHDSKHDSKDNDDKGKKEKWQSYSSWSYSSHSRF